MFGKIKAWIGITILVLFVAVSAQEKPTIAQAIPLDEGNWEKMLTGEWMVEFYAPWCPACKNLAPTWERFAAAAGKIDVNVAVIDVTTSPSLSGRFFVTAMPTIYHVINGQFRQYRGSRDGDALLTFITHKQWERTEPLSTWKRPDTIHMSILSYFFKLSHALKDFNAQLQEDYGLPTWGSYALFAIGTIFVGAALGLLLVCIVDFVFPPKKTHRQSFSESQHKLHVEDIVNDELIDDADEKADNETHSEDDEEEQEDDDEDEENENFEDDAPLSSTSDGEKNSNSESEEPESEKKVTVKTKDKSSGDAAAAATPDNSTETILAAAGAPANPPRQTKPDAETPPKVSPSEVRKRKPRKD